METPIRAGVVWPWVTQHGPPVPAASGPADLTGSGYLLPMRLGPYRPAAVVVTVVLAACSPGPSGGDPAHATLPERPTTTAAEGVVVVAAEGGVPHLVDPGSWCMRNADFGDPADSLYVLPFAPGQRYRLDQSYCNSQGTHKNQMAYDFDLPMGTDVVAARGGVVIDINERTADGPFGTANYIVIDHGDGTYALYGHLRFHGVDVEVGQRVEAGRRIGSSGASGCAFGPHLHFAVGRSIPTAEGADVAVNFSNAEGELDLLGGLLDGVSYLALEQGTPIEHLERVPIGDHSGAGLDGLELPGATLWAFGFSGASLRDSDLAGAVLRRTDLAGANLSNAVLRGADLRGAILRNAYLAATDLRGTDLRGAGLEGASLIGVEWDGSTRWPEGFAPPPRP